MRSGLIVGIGGPLFTAWISPSEEEIRAKYNPELRQRSIEGKAAREQEFDEFVTKLKEYSKSDKPSTCENNWGIQYCFTNVDTSLGCCQGSGGI